MSEIHTGDHVTAFYKTGKYMGEVTDVRPDKILVRVLAVANHPTQGDLHSPKDADVLLFHERRALSYREQAWIPIKMVKPFAEEIPDYKTSLQAAVDKMKQQLTEDGSLWAQKSIANIQSLEKEYF